jgi:hypothetical protein
MLRIDGKEIAVEKDEIGAGLLSASGVGSNRAERDQEEARLGHGGSESGGWRQGIMTRGPTRCQ